MKELLKKFEQDEWERLPCSPELGQCDFHVFYPVGEALAKRLNHIDEKFIKFFFNLFIKPHVGCVKYKIL